MDSEQLRPSAEEQEQTASLPEPQQQQEQQEQDVATAEEPQREAAPAEDASQDAAPHDASVETVASTTGEDALPEPAPAVDSTESLAREDSQAARTAPGDASATASAVVASWWDALLFEGKSFTTLQPEGTLMLKATPFSPERPLQPLHEESAAATIIALRARFVDASAQVQALADEWDAAEEKRKLWSKVGRVRDYLLHAVAIGDFAPLYQQLALWENSLQEGQEAAYADRLALVEKAEALSAGEPSKEATAALRDIGETWKALMPMADKERADALWERLEAARNTFHDRKRERQEASQAEMANNYDLKKEMVDAAEQLAASDEWKASTQAFNELMDKWKATGRTFNDKNEALWQRFITARNVFFDKKRQHFELIQTEQEGNYTLKLALVEEAEAMAESTDWNKTANAYNELMDRWKAVGKVPIEKADELWDRLRKAKDVFYNARRQHSASERVVHDDNYAQKSAIIRRAETLQNSTSWGDATAEFGELLEDWKKIGPVDHRRSQPLWEAFSKARRTFFARKDEYFDKRREQHQRMHVERASQAKEFIVRLREELKEDEENLADYHLSLGNLTGAGKKDDQIRANLERLIAQTGPRIEKKRQKIAELEGQTESAARPAGNDRRPSPERNEQRQSAPQAANVIEPVPDTAPADDAQPAAESIAKTEDVSAQPQDEITPDAQTDSGDVPEPDGDGPAADEAQIMA